MLLKAADDKTKDIETLEALLRHPKATASVRQMIEREIRNIRSGMKGEAETAYELEFHFQSRNWMVIHDLRIEHEGRVAQIDHLLINRCMTMYVCESKRFSEGVAINEQGEFSAFFNHRPYGIPSPIEQNKRHLMVLDTLFKDDVIKLPRRLGFKINPELESYVLVSKAARITRPKATKIQGLENVIKTDQFVSRVDRDLSNDNPLWVTKVVSQDTLEALARQFVALHKPIQFDWAAKFGLNGEDALSKDLPAKNAEVVIAGQGPVAPSNSKLFCSACDASVSYAVAKFCWGNRRFGGKIFCMGCQKTV